MHNLNIDVRAETARKALKLISARMRLWSRGDFNSEATMDISNDAIEAAYEDGFTGFRAVAEISWALDHEDGGHQLIPY